MDRLLGSRSRDSSAQSLEPFRRWAVRRLASPTTLRPTTEVPPGRQTRPTCSLRAIAAGFTNLWRVRIDASSGGPQGDVEPVTAPTNVAVPSQHFGGWQAARVCLIFVGHYCVHAQLQSGQARDSGASAHDCFRRAAFVVQRTSFRGWIANCARQVGSPARSVRCLRGRFRAAPTDERRSGCALSGLVTGREAYCVRPDRSERGQPRRHRSRDRQNHAGIGLATGRRGMSVVVPRRLPNRYDPRRARQRSLRAAVESVGFRLGVRTIIARRRGKASSPHGRGLRTVSHLRAQLVQGWRCSRLLPRPIAS